MNRRSNMPPMGGDARNKSLNRDQQMGGASGGFYQMPGKKIPPPRSAAPAEAEVTRERAINMADVKRKALGTVEEYYMNKNLEVNRNLG